MIKKRKLKTALIVAVGLLVGTLSLSLNVLAEQVPLFMLGEAIVKESEEDGAVGRSLTEAPTVAVKSGELSRTLPTKEQITAKFNSIKAAGTPYKVEPSIKAPYTIGELTASFLNQGLSYLNFIRYSAGLPEVTLSDEYNKDAQYGAVLLAANDELTHYPEQPSDMNNNFYNRGYEATTSSNLSYRWGYGTLGLDSSISGCMDDFGSSNAICMGHRRWLLNPDLGQVGFGYAESKSDAVYMVTKIFDWSAEEMDYDFISWPASGNFPSEAISTGASWSITLNPDKYQTPLKSNLVITVTRSSDGKKWTFDKDTTADPAGGYGEQAYFVVNNEGYGISNCLIFGLGNIGETTYGNDTYTVLVTGLQSRSGKEVSLKYNVDFFQATGIQMNVSEVTIKNGTRYELTVKSNSAVYSISPYDIIWTSSNPDVADVEYGRVYALKEGNATITASHGEAKATCNITVVPADISGGESSGQTGTTNGFETEIELKNGWYTEGGKDYWYEDGLKQGTTGRGKEIYDPDSDAWYWLDAIQGGAKAVSKDVYQESWAGEFADREDGTGKWVRYDENGHMVKGWQTTEDNTYYFDLQTGAMAKGSVVIDNLPCYFDEITGVGLDVSWIEEGGKLYWYEDGKRQGYDPYNNAYRGKEIYDPISDAWYWLDNIQQGAKAVSKDVYQESSGGKWVRYDSEGRMIKGWQTTEAGTYYFDWTTGAMYKGNVNIDGKDYYFDEVTGVLSYSSGL